MAFFDPDTQRRIGPVSALDTADPLATLPAARKPVAAGTAAGRAAGTTARKLGRTARQFGTSLANAGLQTGAAAVNAYTYPYRAIGGFSRDFVQGFEGAPASPNAGKPLAGITAPQIDMPGATPAAPTFANVRSNVATHASDPSARRPDFSNVQAGASTGAPAHPAIDAGVTLPDGRKLPYGAMVNGVPTFSDGSGPTAGGQPSIPRTMSQQSIDALGGRLNVVPATAFTNPVPAFNSDNSEANIAALMRTNQGPKFGITPEMNANADLAAVTNQDARTTLGRAALNASRRAAGATTTMQRKAALDSLAGLEDATRRNAEGTIANAGANERANTEAATTLQRQTLANQGALAQQGLQNQGELARTGLAGQYGLAGDLAQARVRAQSAETLTAKDLNAEAIKLYPQVLGIDSVTGMIKDPNAPGGLRAPTDDEIAGAIQRAKTIIQGQLAPRAQKPTLDQIKAAAKAQGLNFTDAQLAAYYKQNYGA